MTKFQHVPVQLTRFPTTLVHCSAAGTFGVRPAAVTFTLERIGPVVESSWAVADPVTLVERTVVRSLIVGCTAAGHSRVGLGAPASFVTVNFIRWASVHGTGDCSMLRYGTVWLEPGVLDVVRSDACRRPGS